MTVNQTLALLLLTALPREKPSLYGAEPRPQLVNNNFVNDIIRSVHVKYTFRNFVFFISQQLSGNSDTFQLFFQDFWSEFHIVPSVIITNHNDSSMLRDFLSTPAICFVFTTDVDDPVMDLAAKSMSSVRWLKTIFVLFPVLSTDAFYESFESQTSFNELIHNLYAWIWKMQFVNTVVLTIRDNVYIHNPYPTPDVINKTNIWNVQDFFKDYSEDFKGYLVDTPVRYDLPRVFPMHVSSSRREGKRVLDSISGTSALLFSAFIKYINATFNDTTFASMGTVPFEYGLVINGIIERSLEISMHSFTYMTPVPIGVSYPIGINDWCIMVPFHNRSPDHLFLQRTMHSSTWILIIFSCVYISATLWLCMPPNRRQFSATLLQAVCSLLFIAPTSVLQIPTLRMRWLFFLLFVLGFIISNMFVCRLASYLTSSPNPSQIDTAHDVIAAKLKVMVLDFEYKMLSELPEYPAKFVELLMIVDKFDLSVYRDSLNTSFGYSVPTDRWRFLDRQQRYLRKPIFRLSHMCMGPFYHIFPMQVDSHLRDRLTNFLMIVSQAGLSEIWEKRTFEDALLMSYVRMMLVHEEPLPLTLRFFRSIWLLWLSGMILAGIVLILEVNWNVVVRSERRIAKACLWCLTELCAL